MKSPSKIPVVIDSREQRPWSFDPDVFDVRIATLKTGDYSLVGLEDRVVLERKMLGDLIGTLIQDWIRFRRELHRLGGFDVALIAVEANLSDICEHRYDSEANPESVLARMEECLVDHGVSVVLWGDARYAERIAARMLKLCWHRFS